MVPTNSNILTPKPPKNSFIVGNGELMYIVLPIGNKLCIVHQGQQLKICNNEDLSELYQKTYRHG